MQHAFYHKKRNIIDKSVYNMVESFFNYDSILKELNRTCITLILKIDSLVMYVIIGHYFMRFIVQTIILTN